MTYDYELILVDQVITADAIGNQIPLESETTILCDLKSISRSEFYNAAVTDLKPEMIFVVHTCEYNAQEKVIFGGVRYNVIRTYAVGTEELELTCEKIAGDNTATLKLIDHELVQDLKTLMETILADPDVTMDPAVLAAYEADLAAALEGW